MTNELTLNLEKSLYEREAILACVQLLQSEIDIRISCADSGTISVTLTGADPSVLEGFAKKFRAELVNQQVRRDLNVQFGNLREMIVQQAFSPINIRKS